MVYIIHYSNVHISNLQVLFIFMYIQFFLKVCTGKTDACFFFHFQSLYFFSQIFHKFCDYTSKTKKKQFGYQMVWQCDRIYSEVISETTYVVLFFQEFFLYEIPSTRLISSILIQQKTEEEDLKVGEKLRGGGRHFD